MRNKTGKMVVGVLFIMMVLHTVLITGQNVKAAETEMTEVVSDFNDEGWICSSGDYDIAPTLINNMELLDAELFGNADKEIKATVLRNINALIYDSAASSNEDILHKVDYSFWGEISGCPSKGEVYPLIVMVDFDDVKFEENFDKGFVSDLFFGEAVTADFDMYPKESLKAWYKRSSYGKLIFSGAEDDIIEVHLDNKRDSYNENSETEESEQDELIKDVMKYVDSIAKDDIRYDSDGNGAYDALCIIYAGASGAWASQWWSKCPTWDGYAYCQVMEDHMSNATVVIHEFGHLLGLPDLYDYNMGGLGSISWITDMMSGNTGDFNALFKILLGWIEADNIKIINKGDDTEVNLRGYASTGDCAIVFLDDANTSLFGEYYLLQYEDFGANSYELSLEFEDFADPYVRIFHVYSVLEGSDFLLNNNAKTNGCNLITTVDKDPYLMHGTITTGPNIVKDYSITFYSRYGNVIGNPHCYFYTGDSFTPYTVPSTIKYSDSLDYTDKGEYTGLNIENIKISDDKDTASFHVFFESEPNKDNKELELMPYNVLNDIPSDLSCTLTNSPRYYFKGSYDFYLSDNEVHAFVRKKSDASYVGELEIDLSPVDVDPPCNNAMSVSYEGVLEGNTEYEFVFPEGMFVTSFGKETGEIIIQNIHTVEDSIWNEEVAYTSGDIGNYSRQAVCNGTELLIVANKIDAGLLICGIDIASGEKTFEKILIKESEGYPEKNGNYYTCNYFGRTENGRYYLFVTKIVDFSQTEQEIYVLDESFNIMAEIKAGPFIGEWSSADKFLSHGNKVTVAGYVLDTEELTYKGNGYGSSKIFPVDGYYLIQGWGYWGLEYPADLYTESNEFIKELNGLRNIEVEYFSELNDGFVAVGNGLNGNITVCVFDKDFELLSKNEILENSSMDRILKFHNGFGITYYSDSTGYQCAFYDYNFHKNFVAEKVYGIVNDDGTGEYICEYSEDGWWGRDNCTLKIRCSKYLEITVGEHEYADDIMVRTSVSEGDDSAYGALYRCCLECGNELIVENIPYAKDVVVKRVYETVNGYNVDASVIDDKGQEISADNYDLEIVYNPDNNMITVKVLMKGEYYSGKVESATYASYSVDVYEVSDSGLEIIGNINVFMGGDSKGH